MDWENERYVRLYTRRTADDLALCWQARLLWPHLIAVADLSGYIRVKQGERRLKLLAGLVTFPVDFVQVALPDLLDDGRVQEIVAGYFIPNYVDAQESKSSDKERQRKRRERLRDEALAELANGVTQRDDLSRNVTRNVTASRNVTSGHKTDGNVTPSLASLASLADPSSLPSSPPNLRVVPPPIAVHEEEEVEEQRYREAEVVIAAGRKVIEAMRSPRAAAAAMIDPAKLPSEPLQASRVSPLADRADPLADPDLEPAEASLSGSQVFALWNVARARWGLEAEKRRPPRLTDELAASLTPTQWAGGFDAYLDPNRSRGLRAAADGWPLAALLAGGLLAKKAPKPSPRGHLCRHCREPANEIRDAEGRPICYPCFGASSAGGAR